MSKNKKVVIACVGVLFILIAAVLFIRNPNERNVPAPDTPKQSAVQTPATSSAPAAKEQPVTDDSHDKVTKVIDQATNAVSESAPGLWGRVMDAGHWIMGFDTKHALILIGVAIFLCSIVIGGSKNKKSS